MSTASNQLVHAFAQLHSATTEDARGKAAGRVYTLAHPLLSRRCASQLDCLGAGHLLSGEDAASAALISVVLNPARARACRSTTVDGILTFLQRVSRYDVLDLHEIRVARERRKAGLPTRRVHLDAAEHLHVEQPSAVTGGDDAMWDAYAVAVRGLPDSQQRAWVLCVEHELPMAKVAAEFGLHRTAVWRQVEAARARIRVQLEAFHHASRERAPRAVVGAPRPMPRR